LLQRGGEGEKKPALKTRPGERRTDGLRGGRGKESIRGSFHHTKEDYITRKRGGKMGRKKKNPLML